MGKKNASINIGMSDSDRAKIAEGLSALLADSYTLYMMTHNFHWNVTGPRFNDLHNMFMGQYTEQWNALDTIAERIRALGHPAPGTYKEFVKLASIKEIDGVPKAADMVRHLMEAQEATARTARKLFPVVDAANDQPTADLLTQRMDIHEKTAWMLRSLMDEYNDPPERQGGEPCAERQIQPFRALRETALQRATTLGNSSHVEV